MTDTDQDSGELRDATDATDATDAAEKGAHAPGALGRLRGWVVQHRAPLAAAGIAATVIALGARGRTGAGGSVSESAASAAKAAAAAAEAAADAAVAASSQVADEVAHLSREYVKAARDQTMPVAPRHGMRWTEDELIVLRDASKTFLEKALELGRSFDGVTSKSIREGLTSKAP